MKRCLIQNNQSLKLILFGGQALVPCMPISHTNLFPFIKRNGGLCQCGDLRMKFHRSLYLCDETTSQNLEVVLVTTPGFWGLVLFMSGIAQVEERDNNP